MLRLAASRGGPRNALGHRPEPEVLPLPAETSREAPKCCAWQHQGGGGPNQVLRLAASRGGPRNALGYRPEPEVLPASRNEPRGSQVLRLAASRGGAALGYRPEPEVLGHRPEPEVLPLPAETSREAPKCCAWQHQGGGPETRSGTVQSLKCCPCQQKRAARLPSAAPGSIKGGGPRNALGHRPEPEVLPLPAETSREAPKCVSSVKRARAP